MLDFDTAMALAAGVCAQGRALGCAPLAVAVVDLSGEPLVLHRADGAPPMWGQIAVAKARTAVDFGCSSAQVQALALEYPDLIRSIAPLASGGVTITAAGGIPLVLGGRVVGALGVSGDTSERDEACARHAASALGLAVT